MMNSIDDFNVTSYGIHVLLLSIFHLVVKVGGCVAEENNFNMNMINYGLVHYNLDNRFLKRSSTSTGRAPLVLSRESTTGNQENYRVFGGMSQTAHLCILL